MAEGGNQKEVMETDEGGPAEGRPRRSVQREGSLAEGSLAEEGDGETVVERRPDSADGDICDQEKWGKIKAEFSGDVSSDGTLSVDQTEQGRELSAGSSDEYWTDPDDVEIEFRRQPVQRLGELRGGRPKETCSKSGDDKVPHKELTRSELHQRRAKKKEMDWRYEEENKSWRRHLHRQREREMEERNREAEEKARKMHERVRVFENRFKKRELEQMRAFERRMEEVEESERRYRKQRDVEEKVRRRRERERKDEERMYEADLIERERRVSEREAWASGCRNTSELWKMEDCAESDNIEPKSQTKEVEMCGVKTQIPAKRVVSVADEQRGVLSVHQIEVEREMQQLEQDKKQCLEREAYLREKKAWVNQLQGGGEPVELGRVKPGETAAMQRQLTNVLSGMGRVKSGKTAVIQQQATNVLSDMERGVGRTSLLNSAGFRLERPSQPAETFTSLRSEGCEGLISALSQLEVQGRGVELGETLDPTRRGECGETFKPSTYRQMNDESALYVPPHLRGEKRGRGRSDKSVAGQVETPSRAIDSEPPPLKREKRVRDASELEERTGAKPKRERDALKYDGKSAWKDFHLHFEACRQYNKWTDEEATFQLFTCCQGDALSSMSANDVDPKEMTYKELVEVMTKEFGPRECPENYFQELTQREQRSGESLNSLGLDIKKLTALAHPKTDKKERDRIAREYFKKALLDPTLRQELFRSRPDTLEEAIQVAQALESFYRSEKSRGRGKVVYNRMVEAKEVSSVEMAKLEARMDARLGACVEEVERRVKGRTGWSGPPRPPIPVTRGYQGQSMRDVSARRFGQPGGPPPMAQEKTGLCFVCQQPGHFARECRKLVCFRCGESGHFAKQCQLISGNECRPTQGATGGSGAQRGPNLK